MTITKKRICQWELQKMCNSVRLSTASVISKPEGCSCMFKLTFRITRAEKVSSKHCWIPVYTVWKWIFLQMRWQKSEAELKLMWPNLPPVATKRSIWLVLCWSSLDISSRNPSPTTNICHCPSQCPRFASLTPFLFGDCGKQAAIQRSDTRYYSREGCR